MKAKVLSLSGPAAMALLFAGFRLLADALPPEEGRGLLWGIQLLLLAMGVLVSSQIAWTGRFGGKARTARGTTAYETRKVRFGPGFRVVHAVIACIFLAVAVALATQLGD